MVLDFNQRFYASSPLSKEKTPTETIVTASCKKKKKNYVLSSEGLGHNPRDPLASPGTSLNPQATHCPEKA